VTFKGTNRSRKFKMNKTIRNIAVLATVAIALGQADVARAADANPPERMTYQGYLVDGNGDPLGDGVPANYDIVFRIYNVKQGGTSIWAEQQTVTVDKGYFSVLLGEGSQFGSESHGALSAAFDGADASDRFIGITVGGLGGTDVEIAPRLRLVSSPFAFTATQARRLTDGSGNANFFKDGATLKLGAGSTPTLTLAEDGDATLDGKFTVNLTGNGTGLQIINGSSKTTTLRGADTGSFQFKTDYDQFYFDKNLRVGGLVESFEQNLVLRPSNNTDTYLKISSSSDKITAQADEFLVQGDSKYLQMKFTSSAAELRTDSSKFYMNKPLEVEDSVSVDGGLSAGSVTITKPNDEEAVLSLRGSGAQGTGRLYVGQSTTYGGGIIYNGDGAPAFAGSSVDAVSFYRTSSGTHHEVFKYGVNSNDVTFNGAIDVGGLLELRGGTQVDLTSFGAIQPMIDMHNSAGDIWRIGMQNENNDGDMSFHYHDGSSWDYIAYLDPTNDVWYEDSDRRKKKNIETMGPVLERLRQLEPVRFNLTKHEDGQTKKLGFIAQDVQKLFPDIIINTHDDYLGLNYHDFGVISVQAIQDLDAKTDASVTALKQEVETLKSEVEVLKARLANSTTQEDRIAKLEELVGKIGQGQ
jgi:hypothetical protein